MEDDTNHPGSFRTRHVLVLVLVFTALAVGAGVIFRADLLSAIRPQAARTNTPAAALLADIDRESARLIGPPRHYISISAKAAAARAAVMRGDFTTAGEAVKACLLQSRIQNWHFSPFNDFIAGVSLPGNDAFLNRLNEWVAQDKHDATPYLLRALYHYNTGWRVRGGRFAAEVETDHLNSFQVHMQHAADDIAESIRLDKSDPYSMYLLLEILAGQGNTPEMEAAFRQSIREFPNYYPLYSLRLGTLRPKWGGSPEEMYAFVDTYAGKADAYSPLKMLYLVLYDDLLNTAAVYCHDEKDDALSHCVEGAMGQLVTEKLEKNAYDVLKMAGHVDKTQFTQEIGGTLADMAETRGGDRYSGAFLQLAADSLGSDNQLVPTDASKNNFMMDRLTGVVWYQKERYDNAEKMYQRAITDLPNTSFPDEEARDAVLAELYANLADVYNRDGQYKKVVIYEKASDALVGAISPGSYLRCSALFKLKLYDEAIADCTSRIENGGGMEPVYWRAKAYEASGRTEAALQDYRLIAGSESHFRAYSAIEISVIYGRRNDMPHMLDALNTYGYLYDERLQGRKDIAVAYNNRCYANMHLGKLRDALKDCTASLRFDSLPDAYQKQQALIRLLKTTKSRI